jgi:hypothetical protein
MTTTHNIVLKHPVTLIYSQTIPPAGLYKLEGTGSSEARVLSTVIPHHPLNFSLWPQYTQFRNDLIFLNILAVSYINTNMM